MHVLNTCTLYSCTPSNLHETLSNPVIMRESCIVFVQGEDFCALFEKFFVPPCTSRRESSCSLYVMSRPAAVTKYSQVGGCAAAGVVMTEMLGSRSSQISIHGAGPWCDSRDEGLLRGTWRGDSRAGMSSIKMMRQSKLEFKIVQK